MVHSLEAYGTVLALLVLQDRLQLLPVFGDLLLVEDDRLLQGLGEIFHTAVQLLDLALKASDFLFF